MPVIIDLNDTPNSFSINSVDTLTGGSAADTWHFTDGPAFGGAATSATFASFINPQISADSSQDNPTWYMVDIGFVERFPAVVSLDTLKTTRGLEKMVVTQKGSRLSVQPVTKDEYDIVVRLGRKGR